MQNELIDQWTKFANAALDAVRQLSDINSRAFKGLAEQQLEAFEVSVQTVTRGLQIAAAPKSYSEVSANQAALANEYGQKLVGIARKSNELLTDAQHEYTGWVEKGVQNAQAAAEQQKKAA
ncbi:MAG TPA: phasin family protein [Gemmatimonadales bacterium]|nr:phasin family protein [Gemmatimonadales bacterium]